MVIDTSTGEELTRTYKRNGCDGDVVLVGNKQTARNDWPLGIMCIQNPQRQTTLKRMEITLYKMYDANMCIRESI